jgi:WhiB family redox-sensing transcriptional regulator
VVARKRPRGRPRKHPVVERPVVEQPLERRASNEQRSAAA